MLRILFIFVLIFKFLSSDKSRIYGPPYDIVLWIRPKQMIHLILFMHGSRKVRFFLLMRGEGIQIPIKAGHHRPASEVKRRWRGDDGLTLNAGLEALWSFSRGSGLVLLKKTITLWFFRVVQTPCLPLDPRMLMKCHYTHTNFWHQAFICGSAVVECLTRYREAAGSSFTNVIALCPWARHMKPSLVLVQPRKTRPNITERLLMGRKESIKQID